MINKIKDIHKAENAEVVFVHCGGTSYKLAKARDGSNGGFYNEDEVKKIYKSRDNVYIEGGIGETENTIEKLCVFDMMQSDVSVLLSHEKEVAEYHDEVQRGIRRKMYSQGMEEGRKWSK